MEKESGIYKIEQISKNKVYVGSSKNMYNRCHRHMSELRHGKHPNIFLQRAFNKYGENDFKIECLEKCHLEFLADREQFYINIYNSFDEKNGFNLFKIPYSSKGKIVSQETKNKLKDFANSPKEKLNRKNRMIEAWKDTSYKELQLKERKKRYENQEYVEKRKNSFSSENYKEKRSEIAKKIWQNEESKKKLLQERKERWDDEEYRKRLSESAKKKWENPEYRKTQSERFSLGQKKRSENPEYRKTQSERAKAQWAERKKICSMSLHVR